MAALVAVDQGRDRVGQDPLARPAVRGLGVLGQDLLDALEGQQRQLGQHPAQVGVVGLHPVLEEGVVGRPLGIEPHPGPGGLPQLRAVGGREQGPAEGVDGLAPHPPDQVHAREDVAPLVGAAQLELAAAGGRGARGSRWPAGACS